MKKNEVALSLLLAMSFGVIIYLLIENQKRQRQIEKGKISHEDLRISLDNIKKEVNELIESKDELSEGVKSSLSKLVSHFKGIDREVSDELISVSSLVEIKEESKAIMSLVKIIENLLKRIYLKNGGTDKNIKLYKLIEYAKTDKLLEKEECHFLNGIREIRNQEAHELTVKKDKNILISSLLTAVSIIFKLSE